MTTFQKAKDGIEFLCAQFAVLMFCISGLILGTLVCWTILKLWLKILS